jgi:hypothetical protein
VEFREYEAFADVWLQAWNDRDVEGILTHYTDDIELRSPMAAHLLGDTSGIVAGKLLLRDYITTVFKAFPDASRLSLLGVCQGVRSVVVLFRFDGGEGAELMELTESAKVRRAIAHFRAIAPMEERE